VRPHLPEEEFHAWLDGQLSRMQSAEIAEHLLGCLICRALEAEVRGVRDRTTALLALAAPRSFRALPNAAPAVARRAPARIRGGSVAAAAAVIIGLGSWVATRNDHPTTSGGSPQLAAAFVAPAILARVAALPGLDSATALPLEATATSRTLTLASRTTTSPRMIAPRSSSVPVSSRRLGVADPMLQVGPAGEGWETASLQEARAAASGALAHLDGIAVNAVRIQPSGVGGRPTAMVRHLLPDGRAVWVVEGTLDDMAPIYRVLEASGLSLSNPRRARPDYIGTDAAPVRTSRMVTVASFLPVDSLEKLAGTRLRLDE
jgi:hypothetical protein